MFGHEQPLFQCKFEPNAERSFFFLFFLVVTQLFSRHSTETVTQALLDETQGLSICTLISCASCHVTHLGLALHHTAQHITAQHITAQHSTDCSLSAVCFGLFVLLYALDRSLARLTVDCFRLQSSHCFQMTAADPLQRRAELLSHNQHHACREHASNCRRVRAAPHPCLPCSSTTSVFDTDPHTITPSSCL